MADFGRGVKAGIVAAIIFSIPPLIFQISTIGGFSSFQLDANFLFQNIFEILITAVIRGAIFGLVFAFVSGSLSRGSNVVRGALLGLGFWFLTLFIRVSEYSAIATQISMNGYATSLGLGTKVAQVTATIIMVDLLSMLLYGAVVGILWDKFGYPIYPQTDYTDVSYYEQKTKYANKQPLDSLVSNSTPRTIEKSEGKKDD